MADGGGVGVKNRENLPTSKMDGPLAPASIVDAEFLSTYLGSPVNFSFVNSTS